MIAPAVATRTWSPRFGWRVPEEFNFGALIDAWATDRSRVALYWEDESRPQRALDLLGRAAGVESRHERARRRSASGAATPVLVMLPRVPAWQVAMIGGLKLGALVIPCTATLRAKDIAYRARHSGARAVVTTVEQAAEVRPRRRGRAGDGSRSAARPRDGTTATRPARARRHQRRAGTHAQRRAGALLLHLGDDRRSRRRSCTRTPTPSRTAGPASTGSISGAPTCTGRRPTPAGRRPRTACSSARG